MAQSAAMPLPAARRDILAQGRRAQGDAGRMGGHPEYVVAMEPGATCRVRRFGRLYGAPAELLLHWKGRELRVGPEDEVFPPGHEEEGEAV